MKVLQIVWHNKEPVFSVDFDHNGTLATAGADSEIKVSVRMAKYILTSSYDWQVVPSGVLFHYSGIALLDSSQKPC